MNIKVIGSGSMWTKYNSASYLVNEDILIDMPNGSCKNLYKLNIIPNTINNILLTHFHGDHYFDIPFYILNKSRSDNKSITIYCSRDGKGKIRRLFKLAFPNSYKDALNEVNLEYSFDNDFKIGKLKIHKLLMEHGRMKPAYGYIISDNDIYVGFTGDTALCNNVEIMAKKCKYLFCDCMFLKGNKKHQGINDIEYLSKKYPNCTFVVSHLSDDTRSELIKRNISNVVVPDDGEEIVI